MCSEALGVGRDPPIFQATFFNLETPLVAPLSIIGLKVDGYSGRLTFFIGFFALVIRFRECGASFDFCSPQRNSVSQALLPPWSPCSLLAQRSGEVGIVIVAEKVGIVGVGV